MWRIKPIVKETPAQLKERLHNHFRYWELYFTWSLNNNIQYIDVRRTPTPVKIDGNGFTLKAFGELPCSWKKYFYDPEDCQVANEKIKQLIESNTIAFLQTERECKI